LSWGRALDPFGGLSTGKLTLPALHGKKKKGGVWVGCGPTHSPPHYTKWNSPPINGQCTNLILFIVALYR